ncbi:transcriptional regulator [Streptomyces sp. V4-01]|uniref:Transcriptional regulator n=1 Tax=Actinacidiphila polyblastidii TaxID=3110430 RepID=A0ABU7PDT9_9ACTN|nr:transcriptional regulator [Streptomyces sp. V4-01]
MPKAVRKAPRHTAVAPRPDHRAGPRPAELARRLTAMMPRAAVLTVVVQGPDKPWPHLEVRARDAAGRPVGLSRTQQLVSARWIIRAHPDAGWQVPRTLDVRSARLGGEAA